jgi:hypothetical protein
MSWFNILKMPYRGPDIRNEAQYKAASFDERKKWHQSQYNAYNNRLGVLRTQHSVDLTNVENPIYQEMKEYQEIRNFHGRQVHRLVRCIKLGKTECNDFYSQELESDNRQKIKLKTTPTGKRDPYVELTIEAYNNLTNEQKAKYHAGMKTQENDVSFHRRMYERLHRKLNLPTFPSPKYGGESPYGIEYTKEEYENMTDEDKKKYHVNLANRLKRKGDAELSKWHFRMHRRLYNNINLPTYYSPEHEQEEQ